MSNLHTNGELPDAKPDPSLESPPPPQDAEETSSSGSVAVIRRGSEQPEPSTAEPKEDKPAAPDGKLIDFLASMQTQYQTPTVTSSSLEELLKYRGNLDYRRSWLKALLYETERELEVLDELCDAMQTMATQQDDDLVDA